MSIQRQQLVSPCQESAIQQSSALSKAQSLILVKIFLNAALACICHAREIIPWNSTALGRRWADDLQTLAWQRAGNPYLSFTQLDPALLLQHGQEFRILLRGTDTIADEILNLLVCPPHSWDGPILIMKGKTGKWRFRRSSKRVPERICIQHMWKCDTPLIASVRVFLLYNLLSRWVIAAGYSWGGLD